MVLQLKKSQKGFVSILKERLDVLLVKKGFYQSRERAKASIMAGIVYVDGQKSDKAGNMIDENAEITVKENICPYVSRGGLKLEKSMKIWPINLENSLCMDIGASTGGFTDCMLQSGARKVYAVDVGYGQLDYKLRIDERVVNMEKCNIRYLDFDTIEWPVDFISIDVSFISLKLVFPVASKLLGDHGSLVCLVKPQFEAGREQVGKKGIVRDKKVHKEVIENVVKYALDNNLNPVGLTYSPVTGAKGNIEYLLYLSKEPQEEGLVNDEVIDNIVNASHEELE
ncbi:MAG: TlyA family RNA methyltransferase [Firmicutes bacterium]|nr:TlyA family RNA methyltransferase [Bacillota bacterium]